MSPPTEAARTPKYVVYLSLILVQAGFGAYGILYKKFAQSHGVNSLVFSLLRDAFCAPILLVIAAFKEGLTIPQPRELPFFFCLGLTGMFGNQYFYIQGLSYTTPNIASIFQPCIPIFTVVLGILTCTEKPPNLRERHGLMKLFGILFASGGAVIMIVGKGSSDAQAANPLLGIMYLLANCSAMAVYLLLQKRFIFTSVPSADEQIEGSSDDTGAQSSRCGRGCCCPDTLPRWRQLATNITAWAYVFGALLMGLASIWYPIRGHSEVFHLPMDIAVPLIYAVLISSVMCYGLITWANQQLSPTIVTAFWPAQVLVAVILSFFVFQDKLVMAEYLGGLLIIAGLLSVTFGSQLEQEAKSRPAKTEPDYEQLTDDYRDVEHHKGVN